MLSIGTGFICPAEGVVVTNYHVIRGATSGTVRFDNGETRPIEGVLAYDKKQDLALLKVNMKDMELPALRLSLAKPKVGEAVFSIGNPQGFDCVLTNGIVNGVYSGTEIEQSDVGIAGGEREHPDNEWIRTSAMVDKGNSGGPVLLMDGTVVGVNTWFGLSKTNQRYFFAASARKVQELVVKALPEPEPLKSVCIRELGKVPSAEEAISPPAAGPEFRFEEESQPTKKFTRSEIVEKISAALAGVSCRKCNGTGKITIEKVRTDKDTTYHPRKDPNKREPGIVDRKRHVNQTVDCPQCSGTGRYSSAQTFLRLTYLAEAMLNADKSSFSGDTYAKTVEAVQEAFRKVAVNRGSSAERCAEFAAKPMHEKQPTRGKPTVFYGYVCGKEQRDEGVILAMVEHSTEQWVFVRIEGDTDAKEGQWCLVGGMTAGIATVVFPQGIIQGRGVTACAVTRAE